MSAPLCSMPPAPRHHLGRVPALCWAVATMVTFLAASSAPSPLYGLYREHWGFSALTLTWVFSVYAFALLAALLVGGRLSDHLGRRRVIVGALLAELLSVWLFREAESVAWLAAARTVQGLATGIATSALSALLLDLSPPRAAMLNGVAPMLGMALGALGAAALVQFAPAPTQLVYELLLALLAVQTVAALCLPDTVPGRSGAWASLRPRLALPPAARGALWRVLPLNTAAWAFCGLLLSLGPTLARQVTGLQAPVVGGALIAALVLPGAIASVYAQARPAARMLASGAIGLTAGLLLTLAGIHWGMATALYLGAVVAGLGMGCGFNGTLRSLVPLAPPQQRAGLMASFYVCSYLGFSVPAIGAGLATNLFGLATAVLGYALVLLALAAVALFSTRRLAS